MFPHCSLLLIAAAFLLSYAFGREDREKKQLSIIFISKTIDDSDFWTQLIDGARMAAEEYEVKFSVCAPETEDDYVRQNELIEQAILEKPDAIVLTPSSFTERFKSPVFVCAFRRCELNGMFDYTCKLL